MKSEEIILRETIWGDFSVKVSYTFSGYLFFPLSISFPESEDIELKQFQRNWNQSSLPIEKRTSPNAYEYFFLGSRFQTLYQSTLPVTLSETSILVESYLFTPILLDLPSKTEFPKGRYIEYILRTGSGWNGNIEEIRTKVYLKDPSCNNIKILPNSYYGYCQDNFTWISYLKNCKPSKDIRLILPLEDP